jgi:hypothetical protein
VFFDDFEREKMGVSALYLRASFFDNAGGASSAPLTPIIVRVYKF